MHVRIKDVPSLTVSSLALLLAFVANIVTLSHEGAVTERTLRVQLTDTIGSLNNVYEQAAKLRQERRCHRNDPDVVGLFAFYNGQKMLYARQATYLIAQRPDIASEVDFNTIARAFADNNDDEGAILYYEKAITATAHKPLYQAMNLRGYANVLFRLRRDTEARQANERALSLVVEKSDSSYWFQAETLQRWAAMEASVGNREPAAALLENAGERYGLIRFPPRRGEGLRNLERLRADIFRSKPGDPCVKEGEKA
jgi:tetratricopeptide (TPR) repeat protein